MLEKLRFLASSAWTFLLPFIKILLAQGGRLLMDAALEAVQATSTMPKATGSQKRDAAFVIIKSRLSSAGVELTANVINLAIEAAVAKIREN